MGTAKSKKGSHKRGNRASGAAAVDDISPQPAEKQRKLDDGAVADDEQAAADSEQTQTTPSDPLPTDTAPPVNGAPSRSSSNAASVSPVASTSQPPIPAHLAALPACPIRLSTFDCARKLRLSPSHLSIVGDKGYRTCRATHGLAAGSLYFELTYMPTPSAFVPHPTTSTASSSSASTSAQSRLPSPAVRVGFSTLQADIDGCVGMDRWGYGASSRGWRGHEGVWEEWEGGEWQPGDVIGVYLTLGAEEPRGMRANQADGGVDGAGGRTAAARSSKASRARSRGGGKSKSGKHTKAELAAMYEKELQQRHERREREREEKEHEKDKQANGSALPTATAASSSTSSPFPSPAPATAASEQDKVSLLLSQQKATIFFLSSSLRFYRNGQPLSTSPAFSNLFRGVYYPTVSLYMHAEVAVNFGPYFQHCPLDVSGGWYDRRGVELVEAGAGDGGEVVGGGMEVDEREERLRWALEERMEELRDRGLLRQYAESERTGLIDNSRHVQLRVEKEREREEEDREKERRQKEKEERERKERLEKEREKEMREQRERERQASSSASRRGVYTSSTSAAAAAAVQER